MQELKFEICLPPIIFCIFTSVEDLVMQFVIFQMCDNPTWKKEVWLKEQPFDIQESLNIY